MVRNPIIRESNREVPTDQDRPHGCYNGWVYLGFETEEDGEWALLVFKNPELAETWRTDNNCYPASEGFTAVAITLGDLEATCESCGLPSVALRGLKPDTLGVLDAEEFIALLKLGEMAVEDGLLGDPESRKRNYRAGASTRGPGPKEAMNVRGDGRREGPGHAPGARSLPPGVG